MAKTSVRKPPSKARKPQSGKASSKRPAYGVREFFLEDFPRTLFPLNTNRILVEKGERHIQDFIGNLLSNNDHFLPQRTVHANKDRHHLRRTAKLDVVAEYFLYDIVFRNRSRFRKPFSARRCHYGYRFVDGRPLPPSKSYQDFSTAVWVEGILDDHRYLTFDISAYFNNLYHHDLNAWFSALEPEREGDSEHFGKFLREINAGRSLDCLPQGLYPAKMVGNDFLRFIEGNCLLKSKYVYRFMDDICLIDKQESNLMQDFFLIQELLGQKGLSINSAKTKSGDPFDFTEHEREVEDLKKRLLKRRRKVIISNYDVDEFMEVEEDPEGEALGPLTEEEIRFVIDLLSKEKIREEDAELVLIVMREHVNRISEHLSVFATRFPHLAKNFYMLCADAEDKDNVTAVLIDALSSKNFVSEYQLFWFGMMLEKYLLQTKGAETLVALLYGHENATDITKAKILEMPENRFGLAEFREGFLREGRSDWLSWSAAVGSLALKKDARNYLLGYFSNGSAMNRLIAEILS